MLASLMRSSLENNIHHLLRANLDRQVCILTAQVGSEPLLMLVAALTTIQLFRGTATYTRADQHKGKSLFGILQIVLRIEHVQRGLGYLVRGRR